MATGSNRIDAPILKHGIRCPVTSLYTCRSEILTPQLHLRRALAFSVPRNPLGQHLGSFPLPTPPGPAGFLRATIVVLLAATYKTMEAESASALLLSTVSLVVTVPIIIAISR
jgi:hypothetical protein